MTRTLSRSTQMIRDALIVALRAHDRPMRSGELVAHVPWIRRDQRSPHPSDWRCDDLPEAEPRPGTCVKVLRCAGSVHTVDWRPQSYELNAHLKALARKGIVRLAEGTVPGRHNVWELTETGAATGEIERLRAIVDLDEAPHTGDDDSAARATAPIAAVRISSNGDVGGDVIDWQRVVEQLGHFSDSTSALDRSHLVTADTYRYFLAAALGDNGIPVAQLELTGPACSDYAAMTLYGRRRIAIAVVDMRDDVVTLSTLAANLMDVLYRTARLGADEHVVVLIGGPKAHSQIEAHLPEALHASGEPFILWFHHAMQAGLTLTEGFAHQVPDLTLTRLSCRHDNAHRHVLAISVGIRQVAAAPGGTTTGAEVPR